MSTETPLQESYRHWYAAKHRKVIEHIGGSQKTRLRWLVENFAAQANDGSAFGANKTEIIAFLLIQGGSSTRLSAMPEIRRSDLIYLAQTVKRGLDLLIDGQQWTVEISEPVDRIQIKRKGVRGVDHDEPFGIRSTWQPRSRAARLTAFLLTACDLIERQQQWLRRCQREDCGRVFVQADRRQTYCSPKCSQTRRTRRFRRKGQR
jgi:hypothetical protein